MDFLEIRVNDLSKKDQEIYKVAPNFIVQKSNDLMTRGGGFYAIWDPENAIWTKDLFRARELIDKEIYKFTEKLKEEHPAAIVTAEFLRDYTNHKWDMFENYTKSIGSTYIPLDDKLMFLSDKAKREDYCSKRLSYDFEDGDISAYDEIISTLYTFEERRKIEWAIGSIIAGDSKEIQKFIALYGAPGCGKGTILDIIKMLFEDYCITFKASALGSKSNPFATEAFKSNALVAIDYDGDLSRIEDNTTLNSLISHDEILINEKFKSPYPGVNHAFLFLATNKPIKITDSKSGIIRRLIVVQPSGEKIEFHRFNKLKKEVAFELGAIAKHCYDVYESMGPDAYDEYRPSLMMERTDVFYNFVFDHYEEFKTEDYITLKDAYKLYKSYMDEIGSSFTIPRYVFKDELKSYFRNYEEQKMIDGKRYRSYYSGFKADIFKTLDKPNDIEIVHTKDEANVAEWLVLTSTVSFFDKIGKLFKAQYANSFETPEKEWKNVTTCLGDLVTSKLHYVKVPINHIVIDFDLKDEDGNKSLERNLKAASKWPKTYAEYSKSGNGIHLHYIYDGDPNRLSAVYDDGIEIKVFKGDAALRRKMIFCNDLPIAHISTGLPLREEKKVVDWEGIKNERMLRTMIAKNLNKEYLPSTKSSIDYIYDLLEDAYNKGISYSVTDLQQKIILFAISSTHNSDYCLKKVAKMHFQSDDKQKADSEAAGKDPKIKELANALKDPFDPLVGEEFDIPEGFDPDDKERLIFYDVEVFKNLFVICAKPMGKDVYIKYINPSPKMVRSLFGFKLVGFNCRRYDNHIMYAAGMLNYSNEELYALSQKIINGEKGSRDIFFANAYNLSYVDVYEMSSKKQSLKKFEIELNLKHNELGLKWDEPAPKELWKTIVEYCCDDVSATEKVFEARKQDFVAREILAQISGLPINATTQNHTARIIFGDDPNPQDKFVYTDLSKEFPGYVYDKGVSTYRGEEVGEGGYVYAEPGMYTNIALLDIASMHPTSLIRLNHFGPYTVNFKALKDGRLAVKHHDIAALDSNPFGDVFKPYLEDNDQADALAYALKIAINIVYGMTSAKFPNKFRMPENVDNIVAKRGALFMVNLKHEVQNRGYIVSHIKTDSIKIPDADESIIEFVKEYGKQYGYEFEHEATYDKMCLVNNAVYIARYKDGKHAGEWTATGKQFAVPYTFKTLFSHEPIEFKDMCETMSANTALYLVNPDDENDRQFVGKVGSFCPVKEDGKLLMREEKDGRMSFAAGTTGYLWVESDSIKNLDYDSIINKEYYIKQVDEAKDDIGQYGDVEWFLSDEEVPTPAEVLYARGYSDNIDPLVGKINPPEPYPVEDDIPFV